MNLYLTIYSADGKYEELKFETLLQKFIILHYNHIRKTIHKCCIQ